MKQIHVLKAAAVAACACASGVVVIAPNAGAKSSPKVSVSVQGLNETLLTSKSVADTGGSYTRSGHPVKYSTVLGALSRATDGKWKGSWDSKYAEWEVAGILGETHSFTSDAYWELFVNNVPASEGASEVKLKAGDKIVFAAVKDKDYADELLGVSGSDTATVGKSDTFKIVAYSAKGKAEALKGATVSFGGKTRKVTGSTVTVKPTKAGMLTLKVSKSGYLRTSARITVKKA